MGSRAYDIDIPIVLTISTATPDVALIVLVCVCVCVLSQWAHRAVASVLDLPSLKCSSHWSLGLYPASVEFLQPGWQSLLHLRARTLCAALSAFPHTLRNALYEYELQQHAAQRNLPVLSGCSLQTRDAQRSL
jgi:hypothetical protein